MAKPSIKFLTDEEIARIRVSAFDILETIGVSIPSEIVSDMLEEAGCTRSSDGKRILIPGSLAESSLSSAPGSVLLAARMKGQDITIPSGRMHVANGGEGVYVKDLLTGESHPSTSRDLIDFTILVNEFPQLDFCWAMVGALDVPERLRLITEHKLCFEHTTKHLQGGAYDIESARDVIGLAALLAGGDEELRKRPILSAVQCPIPPLAFEKGLIEAQVELSRAGIPIVSLSAAIPGITSPVTLSGTLAQVTAENLASLVITQVAAKGNPFIFGSDCIPADLRTGNVRYDAMEYHLLAIGAAQMGRSLGLPTLAGGVGLGDTSIILSEIQDGVQQTLTQALVPSDLGVGPGSVDQAKGASLEQLVMDAWVWDIAREFVRDFEVDSEAISLKTINEAVIDGYFLNKQHTIGRFRTEFVSARYPDHLGIRDDIRKSAGAVVKLARAEVDRVVKVGREHVISKKESDSMHEYIRAL